MHCSYCNDQPKWRDMPHCRECGWGDRPLGTDDICSACRDWLDGNRPLPTYEAASLLFAAVAERAALDVKSVRNSRESLVTPFFCDADGCDSWTFLCASEYQDALRWYAIEHQSDPDAVFGLVAYIARGEPALAAAA